MRKLMIIAGLPLAVTTIGVLGSTSTTNAAALHPSSGATSAHQPSSFVYGEDGDDDETMRRSGGGGGGGGGSLAATGIDAASLALLGAMTIVAGGATYRVSARRTHR